MEWKKGAEKMTPSNRTAALSRRRTPNDPPARFADAPFTVVLVGQIYNQAAKVRILVRCGELPLLQRRCRHDQRSLRRRRQTRVRELQREETPHTGGRGREVRSTQVARWPEAGERMAGS